LETSGNWDKKEENFLPGFKKEDVSCSSVNKSTFIPRPLTTTSKKSFPDPDLFHRGGKRAKRPIKTD